MILTIDRPVFRLSVLSQSIGDDYRRRVDESAEAEGRAMRRHRRLTAKHRRTVYKLAAIGGPY